MNLIELIQEAANTLTVNKMRTFLAILGIIIGIGSVITLISLGQGSQRAIETQIQSLGSNLLTISPGRSRSSSGVRTAGGSGTTLTLADAEAIKNSSNITSVSLVSPEYTGRSQVVTGNNNINTQIVGVYPDYATVHKIEISSGSFITQNNVNSMSKVAVIGPQAAEDLFGEGVDPVGKTIRVESQTLQITGMTVSKGGTGPTNPDSYIYTPLSTAQKQLFGQNHLTAISVEAKSEDDMILAENQIGYLLLERHDLSSPANADFSVFSQSDILDTASQVTGTFTTLLGGIAAISLLVGGIGIMNIMLVTVTERIREIGLRKALGAKKKIIITQFLIEAIMLTVIGGFLGMIAGVGTSYVLSKVMNTPFSVSFYSVALAISVSGGIGILFGWYPAQKAANLQPIEALRYE